MITLEEMDQMLQEIADGFPTELFESLNGGIILKPEMKLNEKSRDNDLLILGEYHRGGSLGKYIVIYYGSFVQVFGDMSHEGYRRELTKTLKHEFTHHWEALAGERGLEIKDEQDLARYLGMKNRHSADR